jgi:hypothetical protein
VPTARLEPATRARSRWPFPAPRPGQHARADRLAAHRLVSEHRLHRADADYRRWAGPAICHPQIVVNDVNQDPPKFVACADRFLELLVPIWPRCPSPGVQRRDTTKPAPAPAICPGAEGQKTDAIHDFAEETYRCETCGTETKRSQGPPSDQGGAEEVRCPNPP